MTITDAAVSVRPTPAAEMESTPGRTEGSSWTCESVPFYAGRGCLGLPPCPLQRVHEGLVVGKHDELRVRGSLPQGLDVVDRPCRPWPLRFAC